MPLEAMIQSSDSQNPAAPEMPLYAVVKKGQFYLLDVEDLPCYTLTGDGRVELHRIKPSMAIKQPFDDDYECPFCFSSCARDYCTACKSNLLEDEQECRS